MTTPKPNEKVNFGEPWSYEKAYHITTLNDFFFVQVEPDVIDRIVQCVNFCAGLPGSEMNQSFVDTNIDSMERATASMLKMSTRIAELEARVKELEEWATERGHFRSCEENFMSDANAKCICGLDALKTVGKWKEQLK
jgi:hypothetical protein